MWKQGPYRKRAKSPKSHLQAYQNIPLFIPYGPLVPTPPPLPPLNSSLPCTSLVHWDEQNLDTFTRLSSNLTDHILQQSNNNMNNATFSGYIGGDDCTGEALRKKELAIRARLEFYSRAKGRDVAIDIRVFAAMIVFFGLDLEKVKSKVNLNQRKILDFYQVKPDGADLTLRNLGICFAYEVCEFHHFHGQGRVEASAVAPECPRFVCHVSFIYLIPLNPAYEQWFWWHYRFRELLKSTLQNSVFQNRHLYSYCQHQQLSSPFEEHEKVQLLTRLCQRAGFGTSPDAVPLSNWNYLGETYPKISDSSKFKWSFTQSDLLIEELTRKPVSSSSSPSLLNNSGKGTSVNPSPLSSTLSLNSSSSSSGYRSNVDTKRKSSLDSSVNNINNNNNNNNSHNQPAGDYYRDIPEVKPLPSWKQPFSLLRLTPPKRSEKDSNDTVDPSLEPEFKEPLKNKDIANLENKIDLSSSSESKLKEFFKNQYTADSETKLNNSSSSPESGFRESYKNQDSAESKLDPSFELKRDESPEPETNKSSEPKPDVPFEPDEPSEPKPDEPSKLKPDALSKLKQESKESSESELDESSEQESQVSPKPEFDKSLGIESKESFENPKSANSNFVSEFECEFFKWAITIAAPRHVSVMKSCPTRKLGLVDIDPGIDLMALANQFYQRAKGRTVAQVAEDLALIIAHLVERPFLTQVALATTMREVAKVYGLQNKAETPLTLTLSRVGRIFPWLVCAYIGSHVSSPITDHVRHLSHQCLVALWPRDPIKDPLLEQLEHETRQFFAGESEEIINQIRYANYLTDSQRTYVWNKFVT